VSQQAPPQYSPDGRWWWDGYKWRPINAGDLPEPGAGAAPPISADEEQGPPANPSQRSSFRLPVSLPVALAAGAALLVLVGAMVAVPPVVSAMVSALLPRPQQSEAPSQPKAVPTARVTPGRDPHRYMPGLTVSDITRTLEAHGFTCQGPRPVSIDPILKAWVCTEQDSQSRQTVSIWARDDQRVNLIDSMAAQDGQKVPPATALSLFDQVAPLPFKSQPDVGQQARTWVHDHIADQYTVTNLGQLNYSLNSFDTGYDLMVSTGS
jgi:hypothetical protein